MDNYIVRLKHDKGIISLNVNASSHEKAIEQVLDFELAPVSAFLDVRDVSSCVTIRSPKQG